MEKLRILYTGNDAMFDGVYLSLLTMLNRTKSIIDVTIFTGDFPKQKKTYISFTKKHQDVIQKLVKKYNKNNTVKFVDCTKWYLKIFGNKLEKYKFTPYSLFRLYINEYFKSGLVLYLDTDTLICNDISKAFNIPMDDFEMCVCRDKNIGWKTNHGTYFNSGVILFNITKVKETKLIEKSISYCITSKSPLYLDQDALNSSWSKIKNWPHQYNFNYQRLKLKKNIVIFHFSEFKFKPKPWQISEMKKYYKRYGWDKWDKELNQYIDMKNSIKEKIV